MKSKRTTSAKELACLLQEAAGSGQLEKVRELLAKGADPNRRATGQPTPLIDAASAGHLAVVKELLAAGADPSFAHGGKRGTTALRESIRNQRFEVAQALIAAGADVHFDWSGEGQNIAYETAKLCNNLFRSPEESARNRVQACLAVMGDVLAAGGRTRPGPFRNAAAFGNTGLMRLLLRFGTDVNELDRNHTALEGAVLHRQEGIAVELLRHGADPWAGEQIFGPILHQAVVSRLAKVVCAIIAAKADLNRRGDVVIGDAPPETAVEITDARGNYFGTEYQLHPPPRARSATALIVAIRIGDLEMAQLLVEGGANIEATDADGFTALAWALKLNHQAIAALLRRFGAKEPAHLEGSPVNMLMTASELGDLEKVRSAIVAGADVNAVYEAGRERFTPLMRAATAGHLHVVDELLKAGANPDEGGVDETLTAGITPLMLAARAGHIRVVKRLLEAGASLGLQQIDLLSLAFGPKKERGRPLDAAIHEAAVAGHTEVVQLLLEAGAKVSDKSASSGDVIEAAAASGSRETLESVLALKTAERQKPSASAQALIDAVESGNLENVRALLDSGVSANARTRRGDTALASASAKGDTEMVKLLLQAGATPSRGPAKAPMNELMMAASGGYAEIVRLLLDAGADIDEQGTNGDTALHLAATFAHVEVLQNLLAAGAATAIRNDEGKTPLHAARQIVSVWSGKEHPLVGGLKNLDAYRRCVEVLEKAK